MSGEIQYVKKCIIITLRKYSRIYLCALRGNAKSCFSWHVEAHRLS